ncbi:MAG: hypothetical protein ACI857_002728 [Arenicella sp.]|jgi:hypothetical protein
MESHTMFGIFKKKTPIEKLEKQYASLILQAFELSKSSRRESDKKTSEAFEIRRQISELEAK